MPLRHSPRGPQKASQPSLNPDEDTKVTECGPVDREGGGLGLGSDSFREYGLCGIKPAAALCMTFHLSQDWHTPLASARART